MLLLVIESPVKDPLALLNHSNYKASLIHIVCILSLDFVFLDLLMQEIEIQDIFCIRTSIVTYSFYRGV